MSNMIFFPKEYYSSAMLAYAGNFLTKVHPLIVYVENATKMFHMQFVFAVLWPVSGLQLQHHTAPHHTHAPYFTHWPLGGMKRLTAVAVVATTFVRAVGVVFVSGCSLAGRIFAIWLHFVGAAFLCVEQSLLHFSIKLGNASTHTHTLTGHPHTHTHTHT